MIRVLIVEDDLLIADMVEEVLVDAGYEVCGIGRTVAEAVALGLLYTPDLAVVDMRLADGGLGSEVGTQLAASGRVGILYATANVTPALLDYADGDACLAKPYRADDLVRSLAIVADIVATGASSRPFPRGLQLLRHMCTGSVAVPHD